VVLTAEALVDARPSAQPKLNIVIIWRDDIGQPNVYA
jgi:hypothetical protein